MPDRQTTLKPSRKGSKSPRDFARRAREIQDRLIKQGRYFPDSTEIIRADRDSR
jgi:hypothetical protein